MAENLLTAYWDNVVLKASLEKGREIRKIYT